MFKDNRNSRWSLAVAILLMSISVTSAYADDDDDDRGWGMSSSRHAEKSGDSDGKNGNMPPVVNAKWKEECGSCHMAYPPRFLSAESWHALMSGLDKHFGSDASVDAATATEIGNFLEQNASTKHRRSSSGNEPPLRISKTSWFLSEHRKVADRIWKDPQVKSPSNCAACHTRADSGSFSERDIKMPR